jgi:hypothetical protein
MQILPDLTEDRWQYNGSTFLEQGRHHGVPAEAWVWRVTNDEGYGEYHNVYTFYVDKVGHLLMGSQCPHWHMKSSVCTLY